MGFSDLKVHVAIGANEETLVFESPLETNKHRLPGQLLQERLWVDRLGLKREKKKKKDLEHKNDERAGDETRTTDADDMIVLE